MNGASGELEFERAARLRDDLGALRRAMEKQAVVLGDGTDADVVAFAHDELEAAVQVFHVRGGRVRGQRGWVIDKVEEMDEAGARRPVPHPSSTATRPSWPSDGDDASARSRASCSCPRCPTTPTRSPTGCRGCAARACSCASRSAATSGRSWRPCDRNAKEAFTQHKLRRAGDLTARSAALQELQDALGLDSAPLRIECIDISHIQGSDVVASLVVFEDGLARKSEYRRFAIRRGGDRGRRRVDRRGRPPPVPPLPGRDERRDRRRRRRTPAATRRRWYGRRQTVAGPGARTARAGHRPGDRPAAQVRLPAEPAGRRRRRPAGQRGRRRARRAGHHTTSR